MVQGLREFTALLCLALAKQVYLYSLHTGTSRGKGCANWPSLSPLSLPSVPFFLPSFLPSFLHSLSTGSMFPQSHLQTLNSQSPPLTSFVLWSRQLTKSTVRLGGMLVSPFSLLLLSYRRKRKRRVSYVCQTGREGD